MCIYSTRLLCLYLFYAAILFHICSNWLLCSASIRHAILFIYMVYGHSVLHTFYMDALPVLYSTWLLCLYSTWVFCASYILHGNFIYIHSMPALPPYLFLQCLLYSTDLCLSYIHSSSSALNSSTNSRS